MGRTSRTKRLSTSGNAAEQKKASGTGIAGPEAFFKDALFSVKNSGQQERRKEKRGTLPFMAV